MSTTKEALAKIQKTLDQIVGVQKMEPMTREKFVTYAADQLAKAQVEGFEASHARIAALAKASAMVSAQFEDEEVDSVKVPIYETEQTEVPEVAATMTPTQAAAKNPSDGTFFEKRLADVAELIKNLEKAAGSTADTMNAEPNGRSIEEDDDDAKLAAKTKKAADEAAAAAAGTTTTDVTKSDADESWPDDMNAKTQKGAGDDWGKDNESAPDPTK